MAIEEFATVEMTTTQGAPKHSLPEAGALHKKEPALKRKNSNVSRDTGVVDKYGQSSTSTLGYYDFSKKPFNGKDQKKLEKQFGVALKVNLHGEKDKYIGAYSISVSGPNDAVANYINHFCASWKPDSTTTD